MLKQLLMNARTPKFFTDTSNATEIDALMKLDIFSGITTNPIIVAGQAGNRKPEEYYKELAKRYPDVPISIQLLDDNEGVLLQEAHKYASISPNIVIKVPMFRDGRGIKTSSVLRKEGINTNVTGLMNAEQLLLAISTNPAPTYVSLFFNRIKDGGGDPITEIKNSRILIDVIGSTAKIIVGSIRQLSDVREAVVAGTHIVTIPPARVWEMVYHPQTEIFIQKSQEDWNKFTKAPKKNPRGNLKIR